MKQEQDDMKKEHSECRKWWRTMGNKNFKEVNKVFYKWKKVLGI